MKPEKRPFEPPEVRERRIQCRRVEASYTPEQHKECPYCFGKLADVSKGEYRTFCDFKPGEDPICFGFPDDGSRPQHG